MKKLKLLILSNKKKNLYKVKFSKIVNYIIII